MMQKQTRLYLQKAGILAAVYVVLRFLLPAALPFFLAWLTVAGFNSARHQIRMRLLPFSAGCLFLAGLAAFVLLGLSAWLLYQPLLDLLPVWQEGFHMLHQELDWLSSSLSGRLVIMVPSVFSWLFGIFLYVISVILFARDWVPFRELLKKLPFASPVSRAGKRVSSALKNWAHVQVRIMFIVALECAVGFWLLRIPGAGLWAVLIGFVDALPVFGTGTVFLPWILLILLQENWTFALWLFLLYGVTWLTREILEPRLLGDGIGMLPICFLISVILGLQCFGASGLVTGPFGVLFVKELWAELQNPAPPETPSASSSADE